MRVMNDTEHIETAETVRNAEGTDAVATLNSTSELAAFLRENEGKVVSVRIEFVGGANGR